MMIKTLRFVFCAYHGSFDVNGNHVLYTVEPYAPVEGCMVSIMNGPSQSKTDAQATSLSHEIFETITDPDPGMQWISPLGLSLGGEIGDICSSAADAVLFNMAGIYAVPVGGKTYNIQLEYSNMGFGCRARR